MGLCNVPIGMEMAVAKDFGVEHNRVRIDFAGLNHMVFGLNVYIDGNKITEKVVDRMAAGKFNGNPKNIQDVAWVSEFVKGLGIIPCGYHRYYFLTKEMLEKELDEFSRRETRAEVVKRLEKDLFELYKDPNLAIKPPQLEKRGGAYYSDAACRLISSIYNDKRDVQPVNTRNNGAIEGIPADSAVEISSVITKNGPKPITVGELPIAVNGLVQQIKSFERTVIEAAITGDYNTALVAMTINPLIPSQTVGKVILDEMLEAHKEYLPNFKAYFDAK